MNFLIKPCASYILCMKLEIVMGNGSIERNLSIYLVTIFYFHLDTFLIIRVQHHGRYVFIRTRIRHVSRTSFGRCPLSLKWIVTVCLWYFKNSVKILLWTFCIKICYTVIVSLKPRTKVVRNLWAWVVKLKIFIINLIWKITTKTKRMY